MKKKVLILIFSILTACLMLACSGGENSSALDSPGPTWEDEIIEDKEYGEIELPEVERN